MPQFFRSPKVRLAGLGFLFVLAGLGLSLYQSGFWDPPTLNQFPAEQIVYLEGGEGGETNQQNGRQRQLVNFWATWCAPCVHEMPLLEAAAAANPGVYFSGWTLDQNPEAVTAFLNEVEITYDIFRPSTDIFRYFEQNGNRNGLLPYTVLLDEKGRILARKLGEFHSVEEISAFISGS